ncbi:MAG: sporulation integral membrane protein YtvI [Oscillospiraceae bacterium]
METAPVRYLAWMLLGVLLAVALFLIFPWLAPFLLALALSAMLEPLVLRLMEVFRLSRVLSAAICVTTLVLLLILGGGSALLRAGYELGTLTQKLPHLLAVIPQWGTQLGDLLGQLVATLPPPLRALAHETVAGLLRQGLTAPHTLNTFLAKGVTAVATAIPSVMLFAFTAVLATYFSSAHRPALMAFLRHQVPHKYRSKLREIQRRLSIAMRGWLKTQGTLLLITFFVLTAGFLYLRIDLALIIAAGTALLDALPVFGTGLVLLPWAAVSLLMGDYHRALVFSLLYASLSILRSFLEPKLVGDRVGLHPLAALFAMYGGFCFFGVWGMIFAPLAGIMAKQLHDCGLLRLWRE